MLSKFTNFYKKKIYRLIYILKIIFIWIYLLLNIIKLKKKIIIFFVVSEKKIKIFLKMDIYFENLIFFFIKLFLELLIP
jgi:hypothetical protein